MAEPTPADRSRIHPVEPVPFPEWEDRRVRLPVSLTSFVGREREVAAVGALLRRQGVRLVTLTGPGGVGKTRLALAVADEVAANFAGGVVFVSLAPIRDPALLLPTVAQTLGIREGGDRPSVDRLAAALSGNEGLLILDNLEQLLDAASAVADLLVACPALTILATSRVPLRISGEHQFPVPPLALPAGDRLLAAEELGAVEAVTLFAARAREHDPTFALTAGNAGSVATICRRLDGLPLAIELAAARVNVLSPGALEARLTERLRLLTGGAREQPPRLRSMRDAIAWSHDLLAYAEQVLFRRLAVFAGGFTLEAAEAVCGDRETDVLEALTVLVDHSLVRRTAEGDTVDRYGMLETVREYAAEQLEASGETDDLRARHAAFFADLAGRQGPTWWLPAAIASEQPNMRAATAWALAHGSAEMLLSLAIALWQYLEPAVDYAAVEQAVLATASVPPALRGKRALLLAATAQYALWRGESARAVALVDECAVLARDIDADTSVALALMVSGLVASNLGDLDRAEALAADSLDRWRRLAERSWTGEALGLLGRIARAGGNLDRADALLAEAVEIGRTAGPVSALVLALEGWGTLALNGGDYGRAASLFAEALSLAVAGIDPSIVEMCVTSLGFLAGAANRPEQAAHLIGAAEARNQRYGLDWSPADRVWLGEWLTRVRGGLPEAVFAAAWEAGRTLPWQQVIAEAVAVAEAIRAESVPDDVARPPARPGAAFNLTRRESEVLGLLAEGRSDREIAAALFISPKTAGIHVANILGKLGVPSRAAAVAYAHRHGLVSSKAGIHFD